MFCLETRHKGIEMAKPSGRVKVNSELKEKERPSSDRRLRLFEKFNLPAPVAPPPSERRREGVHLAETVVSPHPPAASYRSDVSLTVSRRRSDDEMGAAYAAKSPRKAKDKSNSAAAILLILLFGFIGYGIGEWRNSGASSGVTEDKADLKTAEQALQERVQFHRSLTGTKLNRDRIQVEVENALTAPVPTSNTYAAPPRDMMAGVPLVAETLPNPSYRDRLKAANPDLADARIMYTLQEQQAANDWEEEARQQYIQEFITNAAKAGYKVKVDENGIVTVLGRIHPAEANRLPSTSGAAR